jgi:hypothetical protein
MFGNSFFFQPLSLNSFVYKREKREMEGEKFRCKNELEQSRLYKPYSASGGKESRGGNERKETKIEETVRHLKVGRRY